jgi:hypothetical protein
MERRPHISQDFPLLWGTPLAHGDELNVIHQSGNSIAQVDFLLLVGTVGNCAYLLEIHTVFRGEGHHVCSKKIK